MTRAKRESGKVRYRKILQAALPLFGAKGFAGTTTRELSHAAGVSDALLYKYFPSKAAIYKGLIDLCTSSGEAVAEKLAQLEPSTESFVKGIYFLFYMVVVGAPSAKRMKPHLDRLLLQSLAGDGAFAKGFHDSKLVPWIEVLVERGLHVAEADGDVAHVTDSPQNRLWFAYQVAFNYLMFITPKTRPVCYDGDADRVFNEAFLFALRGLGFTPKAINKYFNPGMLREFAQDLLLSSKKGSV